MHHGLYHRRGGSSIIIVVDVVLVAVGGISASRGGWRERGVHDY